MEVCLCNDFCELNEIDMYAIDGGLNPVTGVIIKEAVKTVVKVVPYAGAVVLAGVAVGFVYEMAFGE